MRKEKKLLPDLEDLYGFIIQHWHMELAALRDNKKQQLQISNLSDFPHLTSPKPLAGKIDKTNNYHSELKEISNKLCRLAEIYDPVESGGSVNNRDLIAILNTINEEEIKTLADFCCDKYRNPALSYRIASYFHHLNAAVPGKYQDLLSLRIDRLESLLTRDIQAATGYDGMVDPSDETGKLLEMNKLLGLIVEWAKLFEAGGLKEKLDGKYNKLIFDSNKNMNPQKIAELYQFISSYHGDKVLAGEIKGFANMIAIRKDVRDGGKISRAEYISGSGS